MKFKQLTTLARMLTFSSLSCLAIANSNYSMLQLGQSETDLTQKLREVFVAKGQLNNQAIQYSFESKNLLRNNSDRNLTKQSIIGRAVSNASLIHVNLDDFYGYDENLNSYLEEALKQNKTIVLENSDKVDLVELNALPFTPKGDIVIYHPSTSGKGDSVTVYSNKDTSTPVLSSGDNPVITPYKFADVSDRSSLAVNDASERITKGIDEASASSNDINSFATGGGAGYNCPTEAKDQRLCFSATVTHDPYFHQDNSAKLNILHHYSVVMYRTPSETVVAFSPNGSANPEMIFDTKFEKSFFLQYVDINVSPTDTAGLRLWSRRPMNESDVSHATSTRGMDFGLDSAGKGSIGYSASNSVRTAIKDWDVHSTTNGDNAHWKFELSKYRNSGDWSYLKWVGPFPLEYRLSDVPKISKYGLEFTAEAIWVADQNATGTFRTDIFTTIQNKQVWLTSPGSGSSWRSRTWTHTPSNWGYWLNIDWLKD